MAATTTSPTAVSRVVKDEGHSSPRHTRATTFAADFVASWSSFAVSLTLSHPIDTLRIRRQTHLQTALTTLRQDGPRSLYSGFLTPLVTNGPLIANAFALNEVTKALVLQRRSLETRNVPLSHQERIAAGGMAGFLSGLVQAPSTVVRIQQQVTARKGHPTPNWRSVVSQLRAERNGRGLVRGWQLEASAGAIGRSAYFSTYEALKPKLKAVLPSWIPGPLQAVPAAMFASSFGWLVIYPIDIIKTRFQGDLLGAAREYPTIRACWRATYARGGLLAFWTGFPLTAFRGWFSSGIMLPAFDVTRPVCRRLFGVEEQDP